MCAGTRNITINLQEVTYNLLNGWNFSHLKQLPIFQPINIKNATHGKCSVWRAWDRFRFMILVSAGFCKVYYLHVSEGSNLNCAVYVHFNCKTIKPLNPDSLPHFMCALTFRQGEVRISFLKLNDWLYIHSARSLGGLRTLKAGFTGKQCPWVFLTLFWCKCLSV